MTSSHTTFTSVSSKSGGSKMSICRQAKMLKNTFFKSSQKSSEESALVPPTTSLGLGGMALAILMVMAILCPASASPLPALGSDTQLQLNRRDLASFNQLVEPYEGSQQLDAKSPYFFLGKRNAELINGLIGMDLNRLSAMGKKRKRGNAELINGLIGMDLDRLSAMGRKRR